MELKEFAEKLNGFEEISNENIQIAKENGFVIVHGASDDLIEFVGAINDEGDCYGGGSVKFTRKGVVLNFEEIEEAIELINDNWIELKMLDVVNEITAIWCPEYVEFDNRRITGVSWDYRTNIPHEKFSIYEDGSVYSIGIVFKFSDLK